MPSSGMWIPKRVLPTTCRHTHTQTDTSAEVLHTVLSVITYVSVCVVVDTRTRGGGQKALVQTSRWVYQQGGSCIPFHVFAYAQRCMYMEQKRVVD